MERGYNLKLFRISPDREGRFGFIGIEAEDPIKKLYLGKRLPAGYRKRGAANHIEYSFVQRDSLTKYINHRRRILKTT